MVAMTNQTLLPSQLLECPSCGRHTIVEHRAGVYRCIACDFERNFDEDMRHPRRGHHGGHHGSDDEVNPLPLLLIGGILVALLI